MLLKIDFFNKKKMFGYATSDNTFHTCPMAALEYGKYMLVEGDCELRGEEYHGAYTVIETYTKAEFMKLCTGTYERTTGKCRETLNYLEGELHGKYVRYKNSLIEKIIEYDRGVYHGLYVECKDYITICYYDNGELHGVYKRTTLNDEVLVQKKYHYGKLISGKVIRERRNKICSI